jgi:hypothetical protein
MDTALFVNEGKKRNLKMEEEEIKAICSGNSLGRHIYFEDLLGWW